jgi:hypothetical protein
MYLAKTQENQEGRQQEYRYDLRLAEFPSWYKLYLPPICQKGEVKRLDKEKVQAIRTLAQTLTLTA